MRLLLLDGRLPLQVRLPAERQLSAELQVSRTTVGAAYEQLRQDGFLVSRRGSGSWTSLPARRGDLPWEASGDGAAERNGLIDLTIAAPAAPTAALHDAVTAALSALPAYLPSTGYDPVGLLPLRQAIAAAYIERGLPTTEDQILVSSGAQHGFALVLRLLAGPGDRVLLEDPSYPNAALAVRQLTARTVSVPVRGQGWDLDVLGAVLRQAAPVLGYLIPDFHNPTGAVLAAEARTRLVQLLRRARTTVVVDESWADLRLDGPALPPPVAAYDEGDRVITVGSLSKSFWGGLRIGWVRAAPTLVARLAAQRAGVDLGTPVLEQLVAAELLERAAQILPERRSQLRRQRDVLAAALQAQAPDWRFRLPHGGLCLWIELPEKSSTSLEVAAERQGLRVAAGPRFGTGVEGALERFLRIPFTLPEPILQEAVRRLVAAQAALAPRRDPSSSGQPLTV